MGVIACIGLGGNLTDPARQIATALHRLAAWPGVSDVTASRLYRTAPWGHTDQPAFVNAAARLRYDGEARTLLNGLLAIERDAGRMRGGERWGPRLLDLDLLVFGTEEILEPDLQVPHPHLHARAFVLAPLAELAPSLHVPGRGTVAALLAGVDASGVTAIDCAH